MSGTPDKHAFIKSIFYEVNNPTDPVWVVDWARGGKVAFVSLAAAQRFAASAVGNNAYTRLSPEKGFVETYLYGPGDGYSEHRHP